MEKRGKWVKAQATVFIILAILVVVSIVIFFFVRSGSTDENLGREYFEEYGIKPSLNNIQDFIIECHKETSIDALKLIGIQGGYYKKPNYYFDMEWAFIPFYYYQGLLLMPTKEMVELEISSYVDENLVKCMQNINFPNFRLTYENPETVSMIKEKETTFTTDLSVSIEGEDGANNFELSDHSFTLDTSINEAIEVADYVTNSHLEDSELICINCVLELARERELFVDFIAIDESTTLVQILENRTMEEPYIFEFLNRY